MNCMKCEHFCYDSNGNCDCDAPYKEACLRTHHIINPVKFLKENFNIKLYWWQKLNLQWAWRKKNDTME